MKRLAIVLLLLTAAAAGLFYKLVCVDRQGTFPRPVFVEIPRGARSGQIGERLADAGVISHPLLYQLARLTKPVKPVLAGEYRFTAPATPAEVIRRLTAGDIYRIELRVPEGSNVFDIAALFERAGLGKADAFFEAASSPALISDLAPKARNLEGYLFPSTYLFRRKIPAIDVCRAMTQQFRHTWRELGGGGPRSNDVAKDVEHVVTLASMVEKEAVLSDERPHIAGVYSERLRIGMKLDCDPTVIYAALLEDRWTGVIHRSDLDSKHPYNTYQHAGLPPGPIANPGRDSLRAALHALPTSDLYFVAEPGGTGAHTFSKDFSAHSEAVASYRRDQRKKK